jgi:hypothetical protein
VAAGDDFIALIARPDCPDCREMELSLGFLAFLKENRLENKIYYVNISSVREDAADPAWVRFKETYGAIAGTPALVRARGGKVVSSLSETGEEKLTVERAETWLKEALGESGGEQRRVSVPSSK